MPNTKTKHTPAFFKDSIADIYLSDACHQEVSERHQVGDADFDTACMNHAKNTAYKAWVEMSTLQMQQAEGIRTWARRNKGRCPATIRKLYAARMGRLFANLGTNAVSMKNMCAWRKHFLAHLTLLPARQIPKT